MADQGIRTTDAFLALGPDAHDEVILGVDFSGRDIHWGSYTFDRVVFLGCRFDAPADVGTIVERGGIVFPHLPRLPYDPYRQQLYTWQELMDGWLDSGGSSRDQRIYDHFVTSGRHMPGVVEALAQRIHDHAIDTVLRRYIHGQKLVGIMGGHMLRRDDPAFRRVAEVARDLTRAGYLVASGGGPGVMEAANLGAWIAAHPDDALNTSLRVIAPSPNYTDSDYFARAFEVLRRYPKGNDSLAVPTWFYGHEPSNVFGTRIAKYFSNSIREDSLLAICLHGIVFAPGSAGTTQEIFQDAAQNHYATFGHISPMVFLGTHRYADETSIYETVKNLASGRTYAEMITLTDTPAEALAWIRRHPPVVP